MSCGSPLLSGRRSVAVVRRDLGHAKQKHKEPALRGAVGGSTRLSDSLDSGRPHPVQHGIRVDAGVQDD